MYGQVWLDVYRVSGNFSPHPKTIVLHASNRITTPHQRRDNPPAYSMGRTGGRVCSAYCRRFTPKIPQLQTGLQMIGLKHTPSRQIWTIKVFQDTTHENQGSLRSMGPQQANISYLLTAVYISKGNHQTIGKLDILSVFLGFGLDLEEICSNFKAFTFWIHTKKLVP